MNICIVSISFSPDLGGVVFDVAQELVKRGHSVSIFTGGGARKNGEWVSGEQFKLFRAYTFDVPWKLRSYICVRNPVGERQWKKFLQEVKPDVVHINQLYYRFPYSLVRIAKKYVDRVFVTAHDVNAFSDRKLTRIVSRSRNPNESDPSYRYPWYDRMKDTGFGFNPLRNVFIRRYLRSATHIITVSDALRRALNENGIQNVVTVHNGVDAQMFSFDGTRDTAKSSLGFAVKKIILSVGRLSLDKGRGVLLDAFAIVKTAIPDAVLVLIGDDTVGRWKDDVSRRGIEHSVTLVGHVSRAELRRWYAVADVVVVPSICFDSFPTINLEAMAASRPVIATCYGGSREVVIDGETGYVVNPLHTSDLSEKIIRVLKDSTLAKRFGEDGLKRITADFRLDKQVGTLLGYYQGSLQ